jgi:hypothetical protein
VAGVKSEMASFGETISFRMDLCLAATKIARLEGVVAQAGEEHIFVPLGRPSDTAEAEFLGEGILQPARQPAKITLLDIIPEAHRGRSSRSSLQA